MNNLVAIAIGGAMGAVLRYAVAGWSQRLGGAMFPVGTLAVNLIGCLLIGILGHALFEVYTVRPELRAAVLIGLLGSFTTFSTFAWETVKMTEDGEIGWAMLYVAVSNVIGLLTAWIGYRIALRWLGV